MILSFTVIRKDGSETGFVEKILSGKKIHTIREDMRWRSGRSIQMVINRRTKNQTQFNTDRPDLQLVISTQTIEKVGDNIYIENGFIDDQMQFKLLSRDEMETLAINDGFESYSELRDRMPETLSGKIVHWTDLKY